MSSTKHAGSGKSLPALSKADTLEMLASAINYCRQAGFRVRAGNTRGMLAIAIDGAAVTSTDGITRFEVVALAESEEVTHAATPA